MYAVIKTGGKQYLVKQGDVLRIERIDGEIGENVVFRHVLLAFDSDKDKIEIGKPYVEKNVEAEIIAQEKGKKVVVIKYKPKTRYRKKQGHRQRYTEVKIIKIGPAAKRRAVKKSI
ncbi:50S ribosomal protein L21 [Patescibacteria group bacterium AH-259-L07]|nr:50S ribosomal protein L21 [Patescibacteria group bacterium AH-259-L07]